MYLIVKDLLPQVEVLSTNYTDWLSLSTKYTLHLQRTCKIDRILINSFLVIPLFMYSTVFILYYVGSTLIHHDNSYDTVGTESSLMKESLHSNNQLHSLAFYSKTSVMLCITYITYFLVYIMCQNSSCVMLFCKFTSEVQQIEVESLSMLKSLTCLDWSCLTCFSNIILTCY